jgi:hypothetical protein
MKMAAVRALAALAKEYVPEQVNMALVDVYILIQALLHRRVAAMESGVL